MNITLLYLLKHIIQLVQTISNNPITILKSFFLSYTIIILFLKLISLNYNFIFLFFSFPFGLHVKTGGGGGEKPAGLEKIRRREEGDYLWRDVSRRFDRGGKFWPRFHAGIADPATRLNRGQPGLTVAQLARIRGNSLIPAQKTLVIITRN